MEGIEAEFEGYLGGDATTGVAKNGNDYCKFDVGVTRRPSDKETQWVKVIYFSDNAWNMAQGNALVRGARVWVRGFLTLTTWKGKNGNSVPALNVVAQDVRFPKG